MQIRKYENQHLSMFWLPQNEIQNMVRMPRIITIAIIAILLFTTESTGEEQSGTTIKGVNYFHEGMGWLNKTDTNMTRDLQLIKSLNASYIRLQGTSDNIFKIVDLAKSAGLDVFLTYRPKNEDLKKMSKYDYAEGLKNFSIESSIHGVKILGIGNELTLSSQNYKDESLLCKFLFFTRCKYRPLIKSVNEFTDIVKKYYSGMTCYVADESEAFGSGFELWLKSDAICVNMYPTGSYDDYKRKIRQLKLFAESQRKPLYIAEFGSLTVKQGLEAGGDWEYLERNKVEIDEKMQAEIIKNAYDILKELKVDGAFIFAWDEPPDPYGGESKNFTKDQIGYGIYSLIDERKKDAFWIFSR